MAQVVLFAHFLTSFYQILGQIVKNRFLLVSEPDFEPENRFLGIETRPHFGSEEGPPPKPKFD